MTFSANPNYLIFGEKVPKFPPDHSNGWHFLRKKSLKVLPNKVFRFIQQALDILKSYLDRSGDP